MRFFRGLFGRDAATARRQARLLAEAISEARRKRAAALAEARSAKTIGDTRRLHEARVSLRHATTDLIRLEMGNAR